MDYTVETARSFYAKDGRVEIDFNARISPSNLGSWVAAWVWVTDEQVEAFRQENPNLISNDK